MVKRSSIKSDFNPEIAKTASRMVRIPTSLSGDLLLTVVLICGFFSVVLWFASVDYYHLHFFETGPMVVADNLLRVLFTAIFSWLIYAPGAGLAAMVTAPSERAPLSATERAVLGFGIGIGIWHVVMLIAGLLGLYYSMVAVGLCLLILIASARSFATMTRMGTSALARHISELRGGHLSPQTTSAVLIVIVGAWLLLVRGLYPGGGGDYYNHYFRYYLEVLKNHGLAPNDVWYQYYYSKGAGLAFLGMLLTDPEAPALTTFACVAFAAAAIATLTERLAPRSFWPAAAACTYLFFYLISSHTPIGAFQKHHEETTALIVLFVWALCMARRSPLIPYFIMAAASGIAAAIVTQAAGILLLLVTGSFTCWSMLRRQWSDVRRYGCVAFTIGGAVFSMFVINYWTTGLASDQALDLMLQFANFQRLDQWGVIPQIIAVAWIRDNYQALPQPFGLASLQQLAGFMRLGILWPFLIAPIIAVVVRVLSGARGKCQDRKTPTSFGLNVTVQLAAIVALFSIVALAMGRVQSISFARFSTFFVPLVLLLGTATSVWILDCPLNKRVHMLLRLILPGTIFVSVLGFWQIIDPWASRLYATTGNSLEFLSGQFSLADAYKYAESPFDFGAINPGALAAAQQLPKGTTIWSTNVHAYCMVPGCSIESVISFKMSGRLDEILGGRPELAKRRLQEAGLDYFLFMKGYGMLDLLPYSRLFAPDTMRDYIGIKWTDGSTFLLTWIGPQTKPLSEEFMSAYRESRDKVDPQRWFRFSALASQIIAIAPRMRVATEWRSAEKLLSWRRSRCDNSAFRCP